MCCLSCAPTSGRVRYILERIVSPLGDRTKIEEIIWEDMCYTVLAVDAVLLRFS